MKPFYKRHIYLQGRFREFSGNGGFGDLRDHKHCLDVAAMYQE